MKTNDQALLGAIDVLPHYLRELTVTIASTLRVDPGMALSVLLSGMAAGVHRLKVVERPDGGIEPMSFFSIVFAGPTAGKTRTHKLVHRPHAAHDVLRYAKYKNGKRLDAKLRLREVIQPLTNHRALLEGLEGTGHATTISTHEGQSFLKSYLFRQKLGVLTVLWDGDDKIVFCLPNGDRLIVHNASLNLLLMLQHDIFGEHFKNGGRAAWSIGFLQRCLITNVALAPYGVDLLPFGPETCLDEYYQDVTAYLDADLGRLEAGVAERDVIHLSPSARLLWYRLEGESKRDQGMHAPWMQEVMNRAMQNVTRLAGVIHCYYPRRPGDFRIDTAMDEVPDNSDEISVGTLKAAYAIVQWNFSHFAQMFPPQALPMPAPQKPTAQDRHVTKIREDAETIMLHFGLHCGKSGESSAPKRGVMSRSGLYPQRFNSALFYLTDQNFVIEEGEGRKARLRAGAARWVLAGIQN